MHFGFTSNEINEMKSLGLVVVINLLNFTRIILAFTIHLKGF